MRRISVIGEIFLYLLLLALLVATFWFFFVTVLSGLVSGFGKLQLSGEPFAHSTVTLSRESWPNVFGENFIYVSKDRSEALCVWYKKVFPWQKSPNLVVYYAKNGIVYFCEKNGVVLYSVKENPLDFTAQKIVQTSFTAQKNNLGIDLIIKKFRARPSYVFLKSPSRGFFAYKKSIIINNIFPIRLLFIAVLSLKIQTFFFDLTFPFWWGQSFVDSE